MEVREMRNPEPVEAFREPRDVNHEHAAFEPSRLHPAIDDTADDHGCGNEQSRGHHATLERPRLDQYALCGEAAVRSRIYWTSIVVIIGTVLAQSIVHLAVVLGDHPARTLIDLDRSNGVPDLISTLALALAAGGAAKLAYACSGGSRASWALLTGLLAVLTFADLVHDGAHPSSTVGAAIIGVACFAAILLGLVVLEGGRRAQWTLPIALGFLLASFLVIGLDRVDHRFERARGEPIAEYQIVAKEALELLGWALVAVALWDEALRGRRSGLHSFPGTWKSMRRIGTGSAHHGTLTGRDV
jgi:hypothetical protein